MKNSVACPNCNCENPMYNYVCSNCRFYLRDRIYNVDLWSITSLIVESPTAAFQKIINAEHKNFIFFILVFICIKFLINVRFISMISLGEFQTTIELLYSYLLVLGIILTFFLVFSFSHSKFGKLNDIKIRVKDSLAIIIYAQIPFLFGLIILFPLELVILGDYLFSLNPSPFVIKGTISYLFFALELALLAWNAFLVYKGFHSQSNYYPFSIISSFAFIVLFWTLLYFCSTIVFTL
jgi:hypothetical protein